MTDPAPGGAPVEAAPVETVVVLVTSERVAPGLLSAAAWSALHAGAVLTRSGGHRQVAPLRAAGLTVQEVAGDDETVLARLLAAAGGGHRPVWLAGPDDGVLLQRLGARAAVQTVVGAHDLPGGRLLDVVAVMDRLRSPGGCPWDARQTHASLLPYLVEEAYEVVEAVETGDRAALREELGDLLLQVAFHARLAQEHPEPWGIDEVAGDLVDKLTRRHPHVFAGAPADDLEGSWEAIKRAEKGRTSPADGVAMGQPALSLATALQRRAARAGLPVGRYDGLAGELWDLVERFRLAGRDPEAELRRLAREHAERLRAGAAAG